MMRRTGSWLVLFLSAAAAWGQSSAISQAQRALDLGDAETARPALAAAAAESLFQLALAERGDARRATLEQASALGGSGSWIAAAARGVNLLDERKFTEAAQALQQAIAVNGADKRLRKLLGDALRGADDAAGALAAYRAATAIDPAYPAALLGVGDLLRQQGDFGGAFNAYNHAVDEQGRPAAALLGRAAASLYLGDSDKALADLERAASLPASEGDRSRALMGIVYVRTYLRQLPQGLERAEQAVALWQQAGRADMAASTANATARVLLETGRADDADAWYSRGLQIVEASAMKPEEKAIWRVRQLHGAARVAAQRRDIRAAQALADQAKAAMDADPANAEHYRWIYPYLIGYIRWQDRKYNDALEQLNQSETERAYIAYLIADCYARLRDRAAARTWYERALAAAAGLDAESVIVRPLASAWLAKNPAGS